MDDIAAVQGSKRTWRASVLAFKAVGSGYCSVVRRNEAGLFCLGADGSLPPTCWQRKNEFVPEEER